MEIVPKIKSVTSTREEYGVKTVVLYEDMRKKPEQSVEEYLDEFSRYVSAINANVLACVRATAPRPITGPIMVYCGPEHGFVPEIMEDADAV